MGKSLMLLMLAGVVLAFEAASNHKYKCIYLTNNVNNFQLLVLVLHNTICIDILVT